LTSHGNYSLVFHPNNHPYLKSATRQHTTEYEKRQLYSLFTLILKEMNPIP